MPANAIDEWTVDINLEVGNNFFKTRDTGGAVIYYLKNIEPAPYELFGYSSQYEGVAIVISEILKHKVRAEDEDSELQPVI